MTTTKIKAAAACAVVSAVGLLVGATADSIPAGGMSDSERREMIERVEKSVIDAGVVDAQTNDSGDLGWGEGHTLYTIINMYYATGQTKWLDIFTRHVDTALSFLTDHNDDGFLSWHTNYYTPEEARLKASPAPNNRGTGKIEVPDVVKNKEPWNTRTMNHRFRVIFLDSGRFAVVDEDMRMPALLSPHSQSGLHWLPIQQYETGGSVWQTRGIRFTVTGKPEPGDSFVILPTKAPEYDSVVHDGDDDDADRAVRRNRAFRPETQKAVRRNRQVLSCVP